MASDLTPVPASASSVANAALDTVESRFGQLIATSTTASVTTTNLTNTFGAAAVSTVYKTTYSTGGIVNTTYNSATPNQIVVSRVVFSTPVVLTHVTQYFTIVPSNTTVWNIAGTPSSLLLTPGQNDVVSYTSVVVADSEQ